MVAVKKPRTKKVAINKGGKVDREVEVPVSDNPEIQDGVQPRSKVGSVAPQGSATVGLSLGVTLNMGNFQSARVDVFIQRNVEDDEAVIKDALHSISDMLHDEVERQSAILDIEE